ncbi:MAG: DNA polymerase III subunit delta, partial [Acidimicrobiales bacterium]
PLAGCYLVLVGGGGTVPAGVVKALEASGTIIDASAGTGRARSAWLAARIDDSSIRLDQAARRRLGEHLGDDVARVAGILDSLTSAFGPGSSVGVESLEGFLGSAGTVAPWELTDSIDAGNVPDALYALHRLLRAGGRQSTEVIGILHRHYSNMLRLDGKTPTTAEEAALLIGVRSSFVAKKALEQGRRLGGERVKQAIGLLATADLDIKGATGLPPDLVLEVLVARLARQVRSRARVRPEGYLKALRAGGRRFGA